MNRISTKDATGVAPNGRWYPGDWNALQDAVAALSDLTQTIGLGSIQIGETGLQLLRFGTGEARISGAFRTDGIIRALGGLFAGSFTTTARDAIALGSRPYGLIVLNTTTNRYEWNSGTDTTPAWIALGAASYSEGLASARPAASATNANSLYFATDTNGGTLYISFAGAWRKLAPGLTETPTIPTGTITSAMILDGTIADGDLAGGIAPAKIAGTAVVTADARLSDARTPVAHAATHARGGTDVINFSTWVGSGTLAARPSTGLVSGMVYTATDVFGGTSYEYNGGAWVQMARSVSDNYATTLPSSPFDGQEAVLVDSTTNPTYYWKFRYNAGSSSAFKWEYMGGVEAFSEVPAYETATTTTYANLGTVGPSFTLPRAGDYEIELTCAALGAGGQDTGYMSFDIGATAAVDADAASGLVAGSGFQTSSFNIAEQPNLIRTRRKTGLTATNVILARYRTGGSNNIGFSNRALKIKPLRVS